MSCVMLRNTTVLGVSCSAYRPPKGLITWRISARAEISARLLKEILLKSNCRLHGEGFSPGCNSARAENRLARFGQTGLGFSARAELRPGLNPSPCNRNGISARAEKQETIWLTLGSRSDFRGIKEIK